MIAKLILGMAVVALIQVPMPQEKPVDHTYTNCHFDGSSGNLDGYRSMEEFYQCKEGRIGMKGRWEIQVEYGTEYDLEMGRVKSQTQPATNFDRDFWTWCRVSDLTIAMVDTANGKAKVTGSLWYPDARKYPPCKGRMD